MKKYTKFVAQFGLLCLFGLVTAEAKDLPYKGRASGQVVESQFLANPVPGAGFFLWERAEATGNFTEVGRATISLEWLVSLEFEGDKLVFVLVGTFEIAAPDGSVMGGSFCSLQSVDSNRNQIEVVVQHGTGRFVGVTGVIPGFGIRQDNSFSYTLDGLICTEKGK